MMGEPWGLTGLGGRAAWEEEVLSISSRRSIMLSSPPVLLLLFWGTGTAVPFPLGALGMVMGLEALNRGDVSILMVRGARMDT